MPRKCKELSHTTAVFAVETEDNVSIYGATLIGLYARVVGNDVVIATASKDHKSMTLKKGKRGDREACDWAAAYYIESKGYSHRTLIATTTDKGRYYTCINGRLELRREYEIDG